MKPGMELAFSVTIKDCTVQTFRSGGKGGQNQNKRDTGVRIIHRPSGAVGESRQHRTQLGEQTGRLPPNGRTRQVPILGERQAVELRPGNARRRRDDEARG